MARRHGEDIVRVWAVAADAVGVAEDVGELPRELDGAGGGGVFAGIVGIGVEDAVWFGLGVFRVCFCVGGKNVIWSASAQFR